MAFWGTGSEENEVQQDLPGHYKFIKDQIADKRKSKNNVGFYFSEENLSKSTQEMQDGWNQKREDAGFMKVLNWSLSEFGSVDSIPPDLFSKPYEELSAMVDRMPVRPAEVSPDKINTGQALAGLAVALLNPEFALDAAAAPYMVNARQADRVNTRNTQEFEDQMRKFQLQFGISREKAGVMVGHLQEKQRMQFQAQQADLNRVFQTRLTNFEAAQRWDMFIAGEQSSFLKMDKQMQNAMIGRALDAAFSETGGPAHRAAAAALLEGLTGKKFQVLSSMTPQERSEEARTALTKFQLDAGKEMLPYEKRKAQLENQVLGITAQYLPAKEQAEIANLYNTIQNRDAGTAQGWRALDQNDERATSTAALEKGLAGAEIEAKSKADALKLQRAKLEVVIREDMEKNGELVKAGGGFMGLGGTSAAEAAKENAERVRQRLAADPEFGELERQIKAAEDHASQIAAERTRLQGSGGGEGLRNNAVARGDMGRKYMPGGANPQQYSMSKRGQSNFTDCSEFTQCVYKDAGISIPGTAQTQWEDGVPVNPMQMQPGDLVFFRDNSPSKARSGLSVHHVGMFVGYVNGRAMMRHASSGQNKVVDVDLQQYSSGKRMKLLGVKRPKAANK